MSEGVDDRYTYPGSGGVLRNQFGTTDPALLDEAMNEYASLEWAILIREPIPEVPDFSYLSRIHERLLGRVVGDDVVGLWAGQVRHNAAPMGAVGTGVVYAQESFVQQGLHDVFSALAQKNFLVELEKPEFFSELAEMWGYLTQIHPFRDGNTRAQSAYIDRLAVHAGHPIDWTTIDVARLRTLRLRAMVDSTPLAELLAGHAVDLAEPEQMWVHSDGLMKKITAFTTVQDPLVVVPPLLPRIGPFDEVFRDSMRSLRRRLLGRSDE